MLLGRILVVMDVPSCKNATRTLAGDTAPVKTKIKKRKKNKTCTWKSGYPNFFFASLTTAKENDKAETKDKDERIPKDAKTKADSPKADDEKDGIAMETDEEAGENGEKKESASKDETKVLVTKKSDTFNSVLCSDQVT